MFWLSLWSPKTIIYFVDNIYDLEVVSEFDRIERIFQTTIRDKRSWEVLFYKVSMDWDQMIFWHKFGRMVSYEIDSLWKSNDDYERL